MHPAFPKVLSRWRAPSAAGRAPAAVGAATSCCLSDLQTSSPRHLCWSGLLQHRRLSELSESYQIFTHLLVLSESFSVTTGGLLDFSLHPLLFPTRLSRAVRELLDLVASVLTSSCGPPCSFPPQLCVGHLDYSREACPRLQTSLRAARSVQASKGTQKYFSVRHWNALRLFFTSARVSTLDLSESCLCRPHRVL